jgi:hypothetical protein
MLLSTDSSASERHLLKTTVVRLPARGPTRRFPPPRIAGKWRNAARIGFGGFFLGMAAINTTVTLPNAADTYQAFADLSWPGFEWLVLHVVRPVGVPFTVLLIAFEIGVTVLVLSKGRRVRLGLLAALGFMIGLAPFISWYELGNVPLMAWALLLLGRDYDRSLLNVLRRQNG